MSEQRANSFLHLIRKSQRGKLKIYLGYCAGVGKTYSMLLEAKRLLNEGVNVMVGYVETHGRTETEALLNGLTLIQRRSFTYHDINITEMDVDAILANKPEVVLVDELAHSNVPGSRNSKRYQDVEEILAAGIHVITTMNVQHIESLYDTVVSATSVKVRERVPDRILVEADQIVNVDVSIEDLIQRLQDGKIYVPEGINYALMNFFKINNLEQLRELALRELAAQIDFKRRDQVDGDTLPNSDQVMVCLSSRGANREKLLRFASRLAGRLNRNWYAVYVQTPAETPDVIDSTTQNILSETLKLARQLGATVFTYKGEDIVDTLLQFSKEYRVGQIVIGTPGRITNRLQHIFGKKSISERLIEESNGATVIVFDTRNQAEEDLERKTTATLPFQINTSFFDIKHPLHSANIQVWHEVIELNEAILSLVQTACEIQQGLSIDKVWAKVMAREQQGATYLSEEIRFPHCRIEGIPHPILVMGIAKTGILDSFSGGTSKLMMLLLSPAEDPNIHIKMIGYLARLASNGIFLKQIMESQTDEDAMKMLKEWD